MAGYTYTKINWENEPSYNTPINETNLNHMDQGIFDLTYVKAEKNDAVFVNSISLDRKAGTTVGLDSVAAGYDTEATGPSSVAIGTNTSAKNGQAVAGGYNSKALGNTSLALGTHCITRLNAAESQAIGNNCIAGSANQMVFGQYNVEDTTGTYAEIVGNGSSGNESNARTLDWQGNETIAGDFTNGNGETLHGIYEALPVDTESGNPTVITDAFGGSCKSLKLTLEPIQSGSGTPSPSNVRPISGRTEANVVRTGKNMWNDTDSMLQRMSRNGATYTNTETDTKTAFNARVELMLSNSPAYASTVATISSVGRYSIVVDTTNITYDHFRLKHNGSVRDLIISLPFSVKGQLIISFDVDGYNPSVVGGLVIKNIQLEIGSTATPYETYTGETYTIDLDGTRYGGVLDVKTGVLTVTHASITYDGSEAWNYYAGYVYIALSDVKPVSSDDVVDAISNRYVTISANSIAISGLEGLGYSASGNLIVRDNTNTTSLASWQAYLAQNSLQVAYRLATPLTVQLTPTEVALLHGDNVLTTDADSIETSYSADIALYIDKKIAEGSQNNRSVDNSSLSKGGLSDEEVKEEVKEEEIEIKEAEPLTKEVR